MTHILTRSALSLACGLGLMALTAGTAPAAQRCGAGAAGGMNSAAALCGCTTVTKGFLRAVTRKDNFPTLLGSVGQSCPKLAQLLTDMPTAAPKPTIHNPPSGHASAPAAAPVKEEVEDDYGDCEFEKRSDNPGRDNVSTITPS